MGMDGLSINPLSIPPVKHMIRSIRMEETGAVAAEALKLHSAEKVFQMLQSTYKDVLEEIGQQK
jgi:signal transduction protein with GAF and PtsI domain